MDVIEQIGAYAGLAAVVGLGVLSALYFSQARDLKRLREWAGRAPERMPVPRPPVVARPIPRPPGQGTMPPRPPAPPVPRPPGAAPGVGAVTPAAASAPPGAPPPSGVPAPPRPAPGVAGPGRPPPAPPATPAAQPGPAASAAGASPPEVKAPAARDERAQEASTTDVGDPAGDARQGAPRPATPAAAAGAAIPSRADSTNGNEEQAVSQDTAVRTAQPEHGDEFEDHEPYDEASARAAPEDEELTEDRELLPEDEAEEDFHDAPERHWGDADLVDSRGAVPGRPTIPIGAGREPEPLIGGSSPPILPPYSESRPGAESPEGPSGSTFASAGRILAVIAATVVAAAVVALAIVQLGGDDGGGQSRPEGSPDRAANRQAQPAARSGIDPASVTVAVLNGTTVPGLAAQLGDAIKRRGFQLGNVTNFIDQQRAESVVLYAPGAEREAAEVGRRLEIAQRAPVDAESQDIAGDATVVVIAGADQTP